MCRSRIAGMHRGAREQVEAQRRKGGHGAGKPRPQPASRVSVDKSVAEREPGGHDRHCDAREGPDTEANPESPGDGGVGALCSLLSHADEQQKQQGAKEQEESVRPGLLCVDDEESAHGDQRRGEQGMEPSKDARGREHDQDKCSQGEEYRENPQREDAAPRDRPPKVEQSEVEWLEVVTFRRMCQIAEDRPETRAARLLQAAALVRPKAGCSEVVEADCGRCRGDSNDSHHGERACRAGAHCR